MPRVIQILNRFVIGGPAFIAANLTKKLAPEFEGLMVVGGKDDHEKDATFIADELGIELKAIPEMKRAINPYNDYLAYKSMCRIIKEFKPDIVHTHAAKAGIIGRLAAHHLKVPVILHTFHGHVFHSYFGNVKSKMIIAFEQKLAQYSSAILAISSQQKNELADVYKLCAPDKIRVLPLGIELDKFMTDQETKRKEFRYIYKLEDDEIAVGIIGRLVPIKDHEFFVKVAAAVLQQSKLKLRFFIIGDGDMRPNIEAAAQQLALDYTYFPDNPVRAAITCTSWIIEIDKAFAGLDIIALTSLNEGTPVSLIESQAAAKPVISTKVGGVEDVVINEETGFLIPTGNLEQYVQQLLQLINQPGLRQSMGQRGRQFVLQHFSMQQLLTGTANLYNELLRFNSKKAAVYRK
ncbi:MAG TPA: glycosyltransferase [Panacibacter sp.]|nr:glycosyltransferase [Panacibacter sp.]